MYMFAGKKTCSSSPESSETEMSDVDDALVYSRWMEREGSMLCTEHAQDNRKIRVIPYESVRAIIRNKPEFHDFVKRGEFHLIFHCHMDF